MESLLDEFADVEAVEAMNKNVAQTWLDSLFLFALVWSVGASVDQEGRVRFDATLRKLLIGDVPDELKPWMTSPARKVTQLIPEGEGSVYDFVFDKTTGKWTPWTKTAEDVPISEEAAYTDIIVPTVDTIRYTFSLTSFVNARGTFCSSDPRVRGRRRTSSDTWRTVWTRRSTPTRS